MNLFREESSNPKYNAQRNLEGRTHYVDDSTLKFHKSRILETHITDNGLLFALIESVALDMGNTQRVYRPVIFDVFGTVLWRVKLKDSYGTRKAAEKAMWADLNAIDAKEHTYKAAIASREAYAAEMNELIDKVAKLESKVA